jgi:hypothetical protein
MINSTKNSLGHDIGLFHALAQSSQILTFASMDRVDKAECLSYLQNNLNSIEFEETRRIAEVAELRRDLRVMQVK